ncbi:MAG TPA: bifunctional (p)ppGpp synthetase/guanosine-3',5'-bis(diphosphate) 3'-pyrophosphohydrolase, partial [Tenericutes bacterium]|nr:bifunctional (p)ppGpp synthetase/guanosine-3',5'-bis(diphosphate) 3'-pyrophosphohydrolase [Mycoplasmatota bacterium]
MYNIELIKTFVIKKHGNQKRKQGSPYYLHPFAVADILKQNNFPLEYQIVGYMHDLLEDTDTTEEEIINLTNKDILECIKLLTKKEGYIMEEYINNIANNEMAKIVKIVDRLHNLSELKFANIEFQKKYISETNKYFIPLSK